MIKITKLFVMIVILFFLSFSIVSAQKQGTCKNPSEGNYCGQKSGASDCYCDDICQYYNDCCLDYADVCTTATQPPQQTNQKISSCADRCGDYDSKAACQCDNICKQYGDCCNDYKAICTTTSGSMPDICKSYFGDSICDDTKEDCGADHKQDTSLDACNECQTNGFNCKSKSTDKDISQLTKELTLLTAEYKQKTGVQKQQVLAKIKETAKERKAKLLALIEKEPQEFLNNILPEDVVNYLPSEIKDDIEKKVVLTANIEVMHVDNFDNQEYSYKYFLNNGNKRLAFYPTGRIFLSSGTKVQVDGYQLENKIASEINPTNVKILQNAPTAETKGEQKTAVFLIDFLDSGKKPFTKEQAEQLIFNGKVHKFYKEESYNQVSFSGDVFGWFTLQRSNAFQCYEPSLEEIISLIVENNINIGAYQRILIIANHPCLGGGRGSVGNWNLLIGNNEYILSISWIFDTDLISDGDPFSLNRLEFVIAHELGHNLGAWHANALECGTNVIYGLGCQHIEYGNIYDTMGTGQYSYHFNAFYKDSFNWLDSESILTIDKSGRYTLKPLESNFGARAAKIQHKIQQADNFPFYLEYRKGIGFDSRLNNPIVSSNQNGLFINYVKNKYEGFPMLLDLTPQSDSFDDWFQVTLNQGGERLQDKLNGITIGPVIKSDDSEIIFDVDVGQSSSFPVPMVNPTSFFFSAEEGTAQKPKTQNLYIYNYGSANLVWEVSTNAPWLTIKGLHGETSGTTEVNSMSFLIVEVDISSLGAGNYAAKIIFTSNGGNGNIPLKLQIKGAANQDCTKDLGVCSSFVENCSQICNGINYYCLKLDVFWFWATQSQLIKECSSKKDACRTFEFPKACPILHGGNPPTNKGACYGISGFNFTNTAWRYESEEVCCDGTVQQKDSGGCAVTGKSAVNCSTLSVVCEIPVNTGFELPGYCENFGLPNDIYCDDAIERCASGFVDGISAPECKECVTGKWNDCKNE